MGRTIVAIALAYMLGSIPFAYLITKWRTGQDIRNLGDGNVGARNVVHMVGPRWGILAGVLDMGKGYAAYVLVGHLASSPWAVLAAGFAAVLGHGFPMSLRGQGGKGVAVTLGFLLGLMPRSTILGLGVLCLARLLLGEFNIGLSLAVAGMILSSPFFGYGARLSVYVLMLFLALWLKKAIDLPRERVVWARKPWPNGALPDWHPGSSRSQESDESEYTAGLPH